MRSREHITSPVSIQGLVRVGANCSIIRIRSLSIPKQIGIRDQFRFELSISSQFLSCSPFQHLISFLREIRIFQQFQDHCRFGIRSSNGWTSISDPGAVGLVIDQSNGMGSVSIPVPIWWLVPGLVCDQYLFEDLYGSNISFKTSMSFSMSYSTGMSLVSVPRPVWVRYQL